MRLMLLSAGFLAFLLAVSCGEKENLVLLEVSFKSETVSHEAGQVFLSVVSDSDWTLDLMGADWAELAQTSGTGTKNNVILRYQANLSEDSRSLIVEAKAGQKTSQAVLVQLAREKDPEPEKPGGNVSGSAPYKWLELPGTSGSDGLDFVTHNMKRDGKTVRNYSLYWDSSNLVARWVAYPLNESLIGKGSRTDIWGLDPLVPQGSQPVLFKAFASGNDGWYARGHQIPSADRLEYESNVQTFYGTNMTPQNNDFNGKVWAELEKKVREWGSASDTLYVVTGCTLDGAKFYCFDNENKKVTVPTGYFKALLRYSQSSSISQTTGGYTGCAFYFEHKTYSSNNLKPYLMSIDQLEEKTGIDFFINLPDVVGEGTAAAIESADPTRNSWPKL